jgi:hypothetical protein
VYTRAPMNLAAIFTLLTLSAAPALSGASDFTLVNGTSDAFANVSIRRAGTDNWRPLGASPAAGTRGSVRFKDPDCAFDIRAEMGGKPVTWTGVNLCDVKSVILNKDNNAGAWVDYDR